MKKYGFSLFLLVTFFAFLTPVEGREKTSTWQKKLDQKMTWDDARHFLGRTGFGGTHREIENLSKMTYRESVDQLLTSMRVNPKATPPRWTGELPLETYRRFFETSWNHPQVQKALQRTLTEKNTITSPQFKVLQTRIKLLVQFAVIQLYKGVNKGRILGGLEHRFRQLPLLGIKFRHIELLVNQVGRQFGRHTRRTLRDIREWWVREMIETDSPFTEKMTLFWHNHFTSSLEKCKIPHFLYNQNALFRRYARGNFKAFVKAISRDPAMVVYLDSLTNRRGKANENFARELMELFTLGEGNYTERDIKQAARAFTGYFLNPLTWNFMFMPLLHDYGTKTFMGEKGHFDGDDIIDIIFAKKGRELSRHIARKLWREFISLEPDQEEVERLAAIFRKSNYHLTPLLRALFTSPHFWDRKHRQRLVKSPVEFVVGTVRLFGLSGEGAYDLWQVCNRIGQRLFDPPNVKGWEGGYTWITTYSYLRRRQFVNRFIRWMSRLKKKPKSRRLSGKKMGGTMMMQKMMKRRRGGFFGSHSHLGREDMFDKLSGGKQGGHKGRATRLQKLLIPVNPANPLPKGTSTQKAIRHLLRDNAYQLK